MLKYNRLFNFTTTSLRQSLGIQGAGSSIALQARFASSYPSGLALKYKASKDGEFSVKGFTTIGITAGLKPSGKPDLAIFRSDRPASAAGCFTKNAFAAAPVIVDKEILKRSPDNIQAVVINAGQANACTGDEGLKNAWAMSEFAKNELGLKGESLVMSTGVIGRPLALDKVKKGITDASKQLDPSHEGWKRASRSIMTTDTVPKLAHLTFEIGSGQKITIAGTSKGAGMIHPNMATMLGVLCTDASITSDCLQVALKHAVSRTYNCIDVDGDTSTNDSVVVLANGAQGGTRIDDVGSEAFSRFREGLTAVTRCLSKQLARDGEGATKFVTLRVYGAAAYEDAFRVAQSIARSSLVKCAMYGKDPNWGRIICAVGYSGVDINPAKVSLFFSNGDEENLEHPAESRERVRIVSAGQPEKGTDILPRCAEILKQHDILVEVDLGQGREEAVVWTCDLTKEYVSINADYTT